jgi:molybdopterin-guanine dinucleotide biosynthesis protein A
MSAQGRRVRTWLDAIQPIVLVGGASRRFGRNKLLEPLGQLGGAPLLMDRAVSALREVFGPRVMAVGLCDELVAARCDGVIADRYPGAGPAGGIVSALLTVRGPVFVLAGDLPRITGEAVRAVCEVSRSPHAAGVAAVLAYSTALEPCVGLYLSSATEPLKRRVEDGGRLSLHDALPAAERIEVKLDPLLLRNANTPGELDEDEH